MPNVDCRKVDPEKSLEKARNSFARLRNGTSFYPEEVAGYLGAAGADYSALDPKSGKTSEQLHAEYVRLTKKFYADDAIADYQRLKKWIAEHPQNLEKAGGLFVPEYVEESLKKAGKGYEIFDPTGKRSAHEIKAKVDGLVKIQTRLNDESVARILYKEIKEDMPKSADARDITKVQRMVDAINKHLGFPEGSEKTADYRILDITGKKSAEQMRVDLSAATRNAELSIARNAFPEAVRRDEYQREYSSRKYGRTDYFNSIGGQLREVGINLDTNHNGRVSKQELAAGVGIKLPTLLDKYNHAVQGFNRDCENIIKNIQSSFGKLMEFAPAGP